MILLESIGVISGLLSVWLATRQNWWTWPIGIANLACFIYLFATNKLYPDAALHVIYLGLSVYGWVKWRDRVEAKVGRVYDDKDSRWLPVGNSVFFSLFCAWGLGNLLSMVTDTAYPHADTFVLCMSVIACWFMARKWIESWIIYIISDIVAISIYHAKGLDLTAGLYLVYLVLCIKGYREWAKELV